MLRLISQMIGKSLKDALSNVKGQKIAPTKQKKKEEKGRNPEKKEKKKYNQPKKPKKPMTPAERKAAKPNFKLVESLKSSWNKVRDRDTDSAVREKLLKEMSKQMDGHILQVFYSISLCFVLPVIIIRLRKYNSGHSETRCFAYCSNIIAIRY